jgi:3-dehydroquinate dehydratase-2
VNVLVLHGPNLNLLGEREPEIYGTMTLSEIDRQIRERAHALGITVRTYQSNHEGRLVDALHRARHWLDGLVINPAAFTYSSYALRDAIAAVAKPTFEVHLSDITKREPWRAISIIEPVCTGQISGRGLDSYLEALERLAALAPPPSPLPPIHGLPRH